MKSIKFYFVLVWWTVPLIGFSQNKMGDRFSPEKLKENYENSHTLNAQVFYEQRIFRNPLIGLLEIKKVVSDTSIQSYVPLFQGMPVGKYTIGSTIDQEPLAKKDKEDYLHRIKFPLQYPAYKFDFWIQPYFTAQFGNFEKPVESNTSIALQTQIILLPGLSLNTGVLFPITNDLDSRPRQLI